MKKIALMLCISRFFFFKLAIELKKIGQLTATTVHCAVFNRENFYETEFRKSLFFKLNKPIPLTMQLNS